MAGHRRRGRGRPEDPLEAYRRVRKPMPPPERVIPDKRDEEERREAEREMRRSTGSAPSRSGGRDPSEDATFFFDRADAGRRLGRALKDHGDGSAEGASVVLGIPRGGVEVAAEIARELVAPLDVVIPRKVGAPGNPELGLGAIAEGVRVLDERLIRALDVAPAYLEAEIAAQESEIRRRTDAYRQGRAPVGIEGRTAIVVDDGVATGGTATASIRWARMAGAARVVFAAPVAPRDAVGRLGGEADEVVVLLAPVHFFAVGQWYVDFHQVSDERVIALLAQAWGDAP